MGWLSSLWSYVAHHLLPLAISETTITDAASKGVFQTIPGGDTGELIHFYLNWSPYLHLNFGFLHAVAGWLQSGFFHAVFNLNNAFEKIFNAAFALMGWDGTLSAKGSPLHGLYMVVSTIGWALLVVGIVIVALQSMGHETKWSKVLPNIMMVALTITVLPLMMRTVGGSSSMPGLGNIAQSAASDVRQAGNDGKTADLALQPIQNNVIDLTNLVRKDWGGYTLKPNSTKFNADKWNAIDNANDVRRMNLGDYLDKDTVDKKLHLDKDHKVASTILQYHLADESEQPGGGYFIVKNSTSAGMGSLNDQVYSRYTVNWIGLIGQSIILAVTLIVATFRVVEDIFELTAMNLIAPVLAYQSIRSTKKLRDLVSSIVGLYLSLVLILLVLKLFFVFVMATSAKVPSSFNWIERSFLIMVIYAGGSYGMFKGVSYFERITGVSQGFAEEFGHAATGMAVAGVAGGLGGAMLGRGMSAAGNAISRYGSRNSSSKQTSATTGTGQGGTAVNPALDPKDEAEGVKGMASTSNNQSRQDQDVQANNSSHGIQQANSQHNGQQTANGGNHETQNSATANPNSNNNQITGEGHGVEYANTSNENNLEGSPSEGQGLNMNQSDATQHNETEAPTNNELTENVNSDENQLADTQTQPDNVEPQGMESQGGDTGVAEPIGASETPETQGAVSGQPEDANGIASENSQVEPEQSDFGPTANDEGLTTEPEEQSGLSMPDSPEVQEDMPNVDDVNLSDAEDGLLRGGYDGEFTSEDNVFSEPDSTSAADSKPTANADTSAPAGSTAVHSEARETGQTTTAESAARTVAPNPTAGQEAPEPEAPRQNVLQRFGSFTTEKSSGLMKKSESYLLNNRFNLSSRGHVNGHSSDHLD